MDRGKALEAFSKKLGYTQSEAKEIACDEPRARFAEALVKASGEYLLVAEVVKSNNCNSGYKVGDQFVLDAAGNFISKRCPQRLCVYLVSQLALPVALINERFCADVPPEDIHFMRLAHCLDQGVDCKGYGGVMVEVRPEKRREFLKRK